MPLTITKKIQNSKSVSVFLGLKGCCHNQNSVASYSPNPYLQNAPNCKVHKVLSMQEVSNFSDQVAKMHTYLIKTNALRPNWSIAILVHVHIYP